MKSTLVLAAGCLIAALAVGDTVYRISPKPGVTYPAAPIAQATAGTIEELTEEEVKSMDADLDSLFVAGRDGLDAAELASVRELAAIARSHASHWGEEFYKEGSTGGVGNVSSYTMSSVTGCWDPTLDHIAAVGGVPSSHYGWGDGFADEYSLAPVVHSGRSYGGPTHGAGKGHGRRQSVAQLTSSFCPPTASVPEPASLSLVVLGAGALLCRRRAKK